VNDLYKSIDDETFFLD